MKDIQVAPFAGAWIEIIWTKPTSWGVSASLPSRERGLKFALLEVFSRFFKVAPFAGAWIEIKLEQSIGGVETLVAPFAGAWIEIQRQRMLTRL